MRFAGAVIIKSSQPEAGGRTWAWALPIASSAASCPSLSLTSGLEQATFSADLQGGCEGKGGRRCWTRLVLCPHQVQDPPQRGGAGRSSRLSILWVLVCALKMSSSSISILRPCLQARLEQLPGHGQSGHLLPGRAEDQPANRSRPAAAAAWPAKPPPPNVCRDVLEPLPAMPASQNGTSCCISSPAPC